jgi:hypothetical protein
MPSTPVPSGGVTATFVDNNSVRSGSIASGSIGQFHIASGAVTSGRIGVAGTPNGLSFLRDDFIWINPQRMNVRMVSASGAIAASDNVVLASGTFTLQLPDPTTTGSGGVYTTKLVVSGGTLSVAPFGTESIDSFSGSVTINTQNQSLTFVNDGTNWWII